MAQLLTKYDLSAIPVVDGDNRLVGIVTFDDAMDVIEEETTEDFEKMAAILPSDKPYLKTGVLETWRSRIPWLMLLMLSATFTGIIITSFESAAGGLRGAHLLHPHAVGHRRATPAPSPRWR